MLKVKKNSTEMIINLFDNHFEDHMILEIVYVSPSYSLTMTW